MLLEEGDRGRPGHLLAPDVPRELIQIVDRCLLKIKEQRWQSAAEEIRVVVGVDRCLLIVVAPAIREQPLVRRRVAHGLAVVRRGKRARVHLVTLPGVFAPMHE